MCSKFKNLFERRYIFFAVVCGLFIIVVGRPVTHANTAWNDSIYSSLRKRASLVLPCWTLNPTIDGRPFCIASAISLYFVHCIVENYLLNIGKSAKIKKCIITEILRFISEQRKRVSTNYQKSPRRYTRCTSSEIQRLL